jgi:hypothetical protein
MTPLILMKAGPAVFIETRDLVGSNYQTTTNHLLLAMVVVHRL